MGRTTIAALKRPALTDEILHAVAKLVDDAQTETREPSHSELEFVIQRAGLSEFDPNIDSARKTVGKRKRIRSVLNEAMLHDVQGGEALVEALIAQVRAAGGFRETSPNYVGDDAIERAASAFHNEGFELTPDGELRPQLLENLDGSHLTDALRSYVRRARLGSNDAALVTGTSKDLVEATAKHVLDVVYGEYSSHDNFPTLLGRAFDALEMNATEKESSSARKHFEYQLYELGLSVNRLRNREGTGHGRPFLPSVTEAEARSAIQAMGLVAQRLLDRLDEHT